jgi:methylmalonyl-CoA mutase
VRLDAIRDVKKQYRRNHNLWDAKDEDIPVFGTIASQFNDPGMNTLYKAIMDKVAEKTGAPLSSSYAITKEMSEKIFVIPPARTRYLSEISENNRKYDLWVKEQVEVADRLHALHKSIDTIRGSKVEDADRLVKSLAELFENEKINLDPKNWLIIQGWNDKVEKYKAPVYKFKVRDTEISIETHSESLITFTNSKSIASKIQRLG